MIDKKNDKRKLNVLNKYNIKNNIVWNIEIAKNTQRSTEQVDMRRNIRILTYYSY